MHFPQSGRPFRAAPPALLIVIFLLSLPAVTVRFYASDEVEYFAYLRSMWFDGDVSFDNEYRYFYDRGIARGWRFKETFLETETATGLRLNFAPIGSAMMWAPFYIATDAGVRAARAAGVAVVADGYSSRTSRRSSTHRRCTGFLRLCCPVCGFPCHRQHAVRRARLRSRCGWGHRCCSTCILRLVSLMRALRLRSRCLSWCGCTYGVSGLCLASSPLVRLLR